jgi:hypothetical protein
MVVGQMVERQARVVQVQWVQKQQGYGLSLGCQIQLWGLALAIVDLRELDVAWHLDVQS